MGLHSPLSSVDKVKATGKSLRFLIFNHIYFISFNSLPVTPALYQLFVLDLPDLKARDIGLFSGKPVLSHCLCCGSGHCHFPTFSGMITVVNRTLSSRVMLDSYQG